MGNMNAHETTGDRAVVKERGHTEIQLDGIEVKEMEVPGHGKVFDVNLCLINLVWEDIALLIRRFKLNVPVAECDLVIKEDSGNITVMGHNKLIEDYMDMLISDSNLVQLVHNAKPKDAETPNVDSTKEELKSD